MMIEVFIVDDHTLFREGLKQIFEETADIVVKSEAGEAYQVLHALNGENYDVIILDISLPDMNGLALLKEIKNRKPHTAVLILSMYAEDQYAVRAFRAGAAGYLTKSQATTELLDAVRKVAGGGKYISESVAEKLVSQLDPNAQKLPYQKLSDREYQVMLMIASGKSVKQIAGELDLSMSTISTIRSRLLKKLNMKNNAEITHYAISENLVK